MRGVLNSMAMFYYQSCNHHLYSVTRATSDKCFRFISSQPENDHQNVAITMNSREDVKKRRKGEIFSIS